MGTCVTKAPEKAPDGEKDFYGKNEDNVWVSKTPEKAPDGENDCVIKAPEKALDSKNVYGENDNKDNDWVNLPTELLVKILVYLSIHDKIRMQYVCRRFRDIGEMPLLWKNFVWTYGPHHLRTVSNLLKVHGEHVRQIYFPVHVTKTDVLEMVHCCAKVTHLSFPRDTQLTLDQLEQIIHAVRNLQQLEVFTHGNFVERKRFYSKNFKRLLKITATSVKELKLRIYDDQMGWVITSIEIWATAGHPLPPTINICSETKFKVIPDYELFKCWLVSSCSKLPSCEIGFYDNENLPMNLYPLVPVRKFMIGSVACIHPFIQLSNHGIVGLKFDIFHLREYDHNGTVRHALTPSVDLCQADIEDNNFTQVSNLLSVSYVDMTYSHISYSNVCSYHLEQLAVACPNLQRLGIQGNVNCLEDLQGLRAIVHTCQNLEILSLNGISVSRVESHLCLWELLSSVKRLKYLAVDLCMVKLSNCNAQKLIAMFKQCHRLQAMEIFCITDCIECNSNAEYLFAYFPSLVHCRLFNFRYSGFTYTISNCRRLRYLKCLYERNDKLCEEKLCPLINNCHLQRLILSMPYLNVSDEVVQVLSAHGELELVNLKVNSITFNGICTLIMNSPNLTSLHLQFKVPLFDEADTGSRHDYTGRVRNKLSKNNHNKLFYFGGKMMILCVRY